MKFVQAQFSLKYEPQIQIRRSANMIEDFLAEHYGPPQTMPIPDDFAAEAPRISSFNDTQGEMCISSALAERARGDILTTSEEFEFFEKHQKKNVNLQITKITKHISKLDFEEEFEEI